MFLLIIILDDIQRLPDLLAAWRAVGIGTTLVDSQGGYRIGNWLDKFGLGGLSRLVQGQIVHEQQLLLSLLEDEEKLEQAITEAERVLGGFERPGSGLLFVLPVARVLGLKKPRLPLTENGLTNGDPKKSRFGTDESTPVSKIIEILGLEACTVLRDDPIKKVVQKISAHPSVNVVGVVSEEGRLIGLIDMNSLSGALLFQIFPEAFLSELRDVSTVMEFVKKPRDAQTAGDIMLEADYVYSDDTIMKAFKVLQKRKLEGIPVVDKSNRPVGYIHLIEIMEICVNADSPKTSAQKDS